MDPYKTLGVSKNATKDEIKQAFRKLAMQFHPDKHHSLSSKSSATHKFKLLTEAYETLIDDRKRADYNLRRNAYGDGHGFGKKSTGYGDRGGNYGYGYGYSSGGYNAYGYGFESRSGGGGESAFARFGLNFVKYLTTKSFLLHATFVSILLGGTYAIDSAGKTLWKMQNTGKSFEEALKSVEKAKSRKDDDDDS